VQAHASNPGQMVKTDLGLVVFFQAASFEARPAAE
jgi:hypothetical protein